MHLGLDSAAGTFLYFGGIIAFFLSIYWRPYAGLYYLAPFLPLQTLRYRMHPFPMGALFVDVMILGVVIGLRRNKQPIFPKTPLNRILLTFAIFTYLSLWAGTFYIGADLPLWFNDGRVSDWKNYMVMFLLLFITASSIRTVRQMQLLLVVMCLGVLMLDKDYLSLAFQRDFSRFSYEVRSAGLMGYAGVNGFAAFQAQFSTFLLAVYCVARRFWIKMGALGVLVLNLLCILYALSRGGYAAFLIGWLFIGLLRKPLLIVLLIVFLGSWQSLVPPAVQERIFMTEGGGDGGGEMDHSAAVRLDLWDEAIRAFQLDPLFGLGFNTYAYRDHVGGYTDTHNLYVKILVETGLFGMGVFLTLLFKLFKTGFRLYRTASDSFLKSIGFGLAAMIVATAVANFFGDRWTYLQVSGFTWVLMGLVVRAQEITDEAKAKPQTDSAAPATQEAFTYV